MDPHEHRGQQGVGKFFLADGLSDIRVKRDVLIEEEVRPYIEAIKELGPYLKYKELIPKEELNKLEVPRKPEVLIWLDRVDKWGFLEPGTYLDQQVEFMDDLETARRIREMTLREKQGTGVSQAAIDRAFAEAPTPERLA